MSKETFKISDESMSAIIQDKINRVNKEILENSYENQMLKLLQEDLKNRPLGVSEFEPDGSQVLKVCAGL